MVFLIAKTIKWNSTEVTALHYVYFRSLGTSLYIAAEFSQVFSSSMDDNHFTADQGSIHENSPKFQNANPLYVKTLGTNIHQIQHCTNPLKSYICG